MNNDTKYVHLSFKHLRTGLNISLNVNNTAGVLGSLLISHFNQTDRRFHKLSIFLLRWHKEALSQDFNHASSGKPMHLVSVYALQLMLLTWMQVNRQMATFDCQHIQHDSQLQHFGRDCKQLVAAIKNHEELQNTFSPSKDGAWNEAKIFFEFINFLANKRCGTFFNVPKGTIDQLPQNLGDHEAA